MEYPGLSKKLVGKVILVLIVVILLCNSISEASTIEYTIIKPKGLKLRDYAEFIVKMKLIVRANKTTSDPFELHIYVNNWWSKLEVLNSTPKPEIAYYDYNSQEAVSENDPFAHLILSYDLGRMEKFEEREITLSLLVKAYKVSASMLAMERKYVGTIEDAKKELRNDYYVFTNETKWWDYKHPNVQRVINEIRKQIPQNATVYDIVEAILYWISTHMYYYEPEDYPVFRLKASEILSPNRTLTTPEGKKKYFGVCRHFVDVFVALARGLRVPANRFEGMLIAEAYGRYWLIGFHAWAEVYMPSYGWIPVEVTLASRTEFDIIKPGDLIYYYIPDFHEYSEIVYERPPYSYLYWIDNVNIVKVKEAKETVRTIPIITNETVTPTTPQLETTTPITTYTNTAQPEEKTKTNNILRKIDYKDILALSLIIILVVYVVYSSLKRRYTVTYSHV